MPMVLQDCSWSLPLPVTSPSPFSLHIVVQRTVLLIDYTDKNFCYETT